MPAINSSLKKKLRKTDKAEKCGLVLVDGTIIDAENVHPEPEKGFVLDVRALAEHEDMVLATWHTHPGEDANLSEEDYAGFKQWPNLHHYIIGVDGVRCFAVAGDFVVEVSE